MTLSTRTLPGVAVPEHRVLQLPCGLRLILLPRHDVPLIAFEALLRGGARLDAPMYAGVASLTAELLTHGAGDRDALGFAEAVEGAGGSLEAEVHSEALILHGQFLARDASLMLELLSDALLRPQLQARELRVLRARRIESIKAAKDSEPQSLIGAYARAYLFAGHPFAQPVGGSEASLKRITRAHVQRFYAQQFGAERLTLVFAGDFDPEWLAQAATSAFGGCPPARSALAALPTPARRRGRRVLLVDAPGSAQSYFWLGNVGVARSFRPRAALEIANTAFGGSFGSMLTQALRVQAGLTYSAGSSFRRGSVAGEFAISSFTHSAATGEALELTLQSLSRLHREGLAEPAIASARNYILGQYPLGFETAADWAVALAELDLFGLPASYIEQFACELMAVDASACRQVIAQAFPDSADLDIVLIADARVVREQLQRFGVVQQLSLEAPQFELAAV